MIEIIIILVHLTNHSFSGWSTDRKLLLLFSHSPSLPFTNKSMLLNSSHFIHVTRVHVCTRKCQRDCVSKESLQSCV